MNTNPITRNYENKKLILGTALWGWGINSKEAFRILDCFLEHGGGYLDVATNYPINNRDSDLGRSLSIISDWILKRGNGSLNIILKVGSIDNSGTSASDLTARSILATVNEAKSLLGDDLYCISVHWDDRLDSASDNQGIKETVKTLKIFSESGYRIGLSGIKNPESYKKYLGERSRDIIIQVKESILTNGSRKHYERFFPDAEYFAYGINLGGFKPYPIASNSSSKLRGIDYPNWMKIAVERFLFSNNLTPKVDSFFQLSLLHAYCTARLDGIIIGPRSEDQLEKSFEFWKMLNTMRPKYDSELLAAEILRGESD